MDDLFDVSGKTALVTGGSRGIGLMIARGLVQAGARVIVSSRKQQDVSEAARRLAELGDCEAIPGDVSTAEGATVLASTVADRFPALDILVNNAGATWGAPLEEFPPGGWDKVAHTNVEGVFHLTVALLPALRAAAREHAGAGHQHRLDRRLAHALGGELQLQREQGRRAHAHAPPRQAACPGADHRQRDRAGTVREQDDGVGA